MSVSRDVRDGVPIGVYSLRNPLRLHCRRHRVRERGARPGLLPFDRPGTRADAPIHRSRRIQQSTGDLLACRRVPLGLPGDTRGAGRGDAAVPLPGGGAGAGGDQVRAWRPKSRGRGYGEREVMVAASTAAARAERCDEHRAAP